MIPTNKIWELINNSKILKFVEFLVEISGDDPCRVYRQPTLIQIAHLIQPARAMYFRNEIDSQPSICFSEPHIYLYYKINNTGRCFEEINFEGGFETAILAITTRPSSTKSSIHAASCIALMIGSTNIRPSKPCYFSVHQMVQPSITALGTSNTASRRRCLQRGYLIETGSRHRPPPVKL